MARNVLLTGSLPFEDAASVMRTVSSILGSKAPRIPDGETGVRSKFITFQIPVLVAAAQFETAEYGPQSEWGPNGELPPRLITLKPGATGTPEFGRLGYADAALESYRVFAQLKADGAIAPTTRFQVGLPTPIGVLGVYMEPEVQAVAEPPYEARMIAELDEICAAIPNDELTVQWDIPEEVAIWEGCSDSYFDDARMGVVERIARLMDRVPAAVEVGLHVCYGDISHQHFKEPDTRVIVDLVNAIACGAGRRIDYVHMPVPRHWTDAHRFAPLADLALAPAAELYLGLVHVTDGVDGAQARIGAASRHAPAFGVAASCGLGRRPPETIDALLHLHARVAEL